MIEVNNLTTNQVDKEFLKRVAKKALIGENKERLELSVVLVGQSRIRKLNKKYRKKNKVTDILSFGDDLNEIVICLGEVEKNAKKYNSTSKKELAKVLIHGILHLLGYDHEKGEAKKGEESKLSSSTELLQEAKVKKKAEPSSPPFAAAREMKEKEDYYLRKIYGQE